MITAIVFIYLIVFGFIGLTGYFIWAQHQRVETLTDRLDVLIKKVRDGEHVIIENFEILEKRFKKVENDIRTTEKKQADFTKVKASQFQKFRPKPDQAESV